MASRSLEDLHPEARVAFMTFEKILLTRGLNFVRACTYRSPAEQNELYAQGRTKAGAKVTWAKGGQSKHNNELNGRPASLAGDYYPLVNGKLADNKTAEERYLWNEFASAAHEAGLEWGGNWKGGKADYPHFQYNLGGGK
jgi:peptidoglycan L-alanyl-D-glutamate endopeptidase CwlK